MIFKVQYKYKFARKTHRGMPSPDESKVMANRELRQRHWHRRIEQLMPEMIDKVEQ